MKKHILLTLFILSEPVIAETDLFAISLEDLIHVEISVASRFIETEKEATNSVESISKKDWEIHGARRTDEALAYFSGVVAMPSIYGSWGLAIRGYADGTNIRSNSQLLDDIALNGFVLTGANYYVPHIGLGTLDKIELIKGAASTLYGSEAFHGVVAMQSYEGKNDETIANISIGNWGRSAFYINSHKTINEQYSLDFAMDINEIDDQDLAYFANSNGEKREKTFDDGWSNYTLITKLHADYGNRGTAKLSFYQIDHRFNNHPGFSVANFIGDQGFEKGKTVNQIVAFDYSKSLADNYAVDWKSYYHKTQYQDYSLTATSAITEPDLYVYNDVNIYDYDLEKTSHNLRLKKYRSHSNHEFSLDYSINYWRVNHAFIKSAGFSQFEQANFDGASRTAHSLAALGKYFLSDHLSLTAGGRYDNYSDTENHFSPKLGAVYSTGNQTVKALYSHAFRAASAQENLGISDAQIVGNKHLKPATLDNYELIYILSKANYRLSSTIFHTDYSDGLALAPVGNNSLPLHYINFNEGHANGLEIDSRFFISDFTFKINASYIRSYNDISKIEYQAFPRIIINYLADYKAPNNLPWCSSADRHDWFTT